MLSFNLQGVIGPKLVEGNKVQAGTEKTHRNLSELKINKYTFSFLLSSQVELITRTPGMTSCMLGLL